METVIALFGGPRDGAEFKILGEAPASVVVPWKVWKNGVASVERHEYILDDRGLVDRFHGILYLHQELVRDHTEDVFDRGDGD